MSRTLKDAPGARQSRRDRRFAEREIPFDYQLSVEARLAAAEFLGLAGLPTEAELAEAPCPHGCRHDAGILTLAVDNPDPDECDVMVRAELTAVANNF
jgi:hypothetical protein